MRNGVFVTGGTGFVGQRVLLALRAPGRSVFALDRAPSPRVTPEGVQRVAGDLLNPASYETALHDCDTVVHLAAATGRAPAEEHARINGQGTEVLLQAARNAGVTRFLFVSSIAVTFPKLERYPYGGAKARAESAVRASGLHFTILRPTMVFGTGSPIQAAFEKLAALPISVLPGPGRALVQPIHVDDLAKVIATFVRDDRFSGECLTVGGPEQLSLDALIRRMRAVRTGSTTGLMHVWLPLVRAPLVLAEALGLGHVLPLTAGQLSSFESDGLAADEDVLPAPRVSLDTMLGERDAGRDTAVLASECRAFTRYLVGEDATDYIVTRYAAAHDVVPALQAGSAEPDFLVAFAQRGGWRVSVADAYAAIFDGHGLLRRKLVLLVALLEACPPYCRVLDRPPGGPRWLVWLRLAGSSAWAVAALGMGLVLILPTRLRRSPSPKAGQ